MTLNINLEDVPDAILEAVKARIMASRRRLLDRQELLRQPPLQPKPQSRKFGADSKRWKRPQPAAVANYAPEINGLILYWNGTSGAFTGLNTETVAIAWGNNDGLQPTLLLGESAITPTAVRFHDFTIDDPTGSALAFETSDFTIEAFVDPQQDGYFTIDLIWQDPSASSTSFVYISVEEAECYVGIRLSKESLSYSKSASQDTSQAGARHICIQRKDGLFYVYCDGQSIPLGGTSSGVAAEDMIPMQILGYSTLLYNKFMSSKVGQMRIVKDLAVYPVEGFTPPTKAFYKPAA
jgi:hypothetical protein